MRSNWRVALCPLVVAVVAGWAHASQETPLQCSVMVPPSDSGAGRLGVVAPGPNGRLAWTDGRPGQFMVRDAAGHSRVIGRLGAGPGEFQRIGAMNWIGDTLWVADIRLQRVQFFDHIGNLLWGARAPLSAAWGASPDGKLVGFAPRPLARDVPAAVLLSHQPGTIAVDTIARFPLLPTERYLLPVGDRMVPNPQPFHAQTEVASSPNRERFCGAIPENSGEVRVHCVDQHGTTLVEQRLHLAPRQVTTALYAALIARTADQTGVPEYALRGRIERPRNLPAVLGLLVDDDGSIWLQRTHRFEPTSHWVRLRPDASVRDSIAVSARYHVLLVRGDEVWATTADRDGLETLHACRLRG